MEDRRHGLRLAKLRIHSPYSPAEKGGHWGRAVTASGFFRESTAQHDGRPRGHQQEGRMDEEVFNTSIRKFLKTFGVTAQREIEKAVREAVAAGKLKGNEALPATMTLKVGQIGLSLEIDGAIELE
jgi:hypothetical protein